MAQKKFLDYAGLEHLVNKITEKYAPIQAFVFKGTVETISSLPTVAGVAVGSIYNVVTGGETTADFVEGAGKVLRDGENVVAVNTGTKAAPIMKWDILGGVFVLEDRLQFGLTMPASPKAGQTFLYMGNTTYNYNAVTPLGSENPKEMGWYEYNSSTSFYELTEDTTVQAGTSYFVKEEGYVKGVIYVYDGTSSQWIAQTAGDTFIAITNAEIDALFEDPAPIPSV